MTKHVTVYSYVLFDGPTLRFRVQPDKRTHDDLEIRKWREGAAMRILEASGEVVESGQLDPDGRFFPGGRGPGG